MGNIKVKTALLADDVILFLSQPALASPIVQKILMEYGKFLGLRMNFTKSRMLPLAKNKHRAWVKEVPFVVRETMLHIWVLRWVSTHPSFTI